MGAVARRFQFLLRRFGHRSSRGVLEVKKRAGDENKFNVLGSLIWHSENPRQDPILHRHPFRNWSLNLTRNSTEPSSFFASF